MATRKQSQPALSFAEETEMLDREDPLTNNYESAASNLAPSLDRNHLVPSSPRRCILSPKALNLRGIANFLSPSPSRYTSNAKNKRRSVMAASQYGQSRLKSIRLKEKEGKTTLADLIDSPRAKTNGIRDLSPRMTPPRTIASDLKGKRRSIAALQPLVKSRLQSVKRKDEEGKTLSDIIYSPSAQAVGVFFAQESKSSSALAKPDETSNNTSWRLKSSKMKEANGLPFAQIMKSPSAQLLGFISEDVEEEWDETIS